MRRFIPALFALPLFAVSFQPIQSESDTQKTLTFLTNPDGQCGLSYEAEAGMLRGLRLPQSYFSTAKYFGTYVGSIKGNKLQVTDVYNANSNTVAPDRTSPGANLQLERTRVFNGLNIKDGALWQLALAAHAKAKNDPSFFTIANGQNELLYWGYDGDEPEFRVGDNRAYTHEGKYKYNNEVITNLGSSYLFSCLGKSKVAKDPFMATSFARFLSGNNLPSSYQLGEISWFDYRPLTKEIAWSYILAPTKCAMIEQAVKKTQCVPFRSDLVENSLYLIETLHSMQSPIGALYETCSGVTDPVTGKTLDPSSITTEANAVLLIGLHRVSQMFSDTLNYDKNISEMGRIQLTKAIETIDLMLNGNQSKNGEGGLFDFFTNYAIAPDGFFYEGGTAKGSQWTPNVNVRSASANVYALSTVGQIAYDNIRGFGASFALWNKMKESFGYYGPQGKLWGLGFTDQDGNGLKVGARAQVISTENTLASINLLRALIRQYTQAENSPLYPNEEKKKIPAIIASLQADHDALSQRALLLRTDKYAKAFSSAAPKEYNKLIPIQKDRLGFVEASKRYVDPVSGQKNPLPHTGSTAWILMLQYDMNPIEPVISWNGKKK